LTLGEVLNYPHDGLLFIPVNKPYDNNHTYKYLYPSETTIDFTLYDAVHPTQLRLYVYDDALQQEIPFQGTEQLPFDDTLVDSSSFLSSYNGNKMIAQCNWNTLTNKMTFVKIRSDKVKPDSVEMAIENWKNMNDPIIGGTPCD